MAFCNRCEVVKQSKIPSFQFWWHFFDDQFTWFSTLHRFSVDKKVRHLCGLEMSWFANYEETKMLAGIFLSNIRDTVPLSEKSTHLRLSSVGWCSLLIIFAIWLMRLKRHLKLWRRLHSFCTDPIFFKCWMQEIWFTFLKTKFLLFHWFPMSEDINLLTVTTSAVKVADIYSRDATFFTFYD